MKIFKNKLIVWGLVVAVAVGGYLIYSGSKNKTAAPQYVTAKAAKGTLVVSVTGSGQISASSQINVQAKVAGTISKIYVANNQRVKANDLLFALDTTTDERAVRNAESNLKSAQLSLENLMSPATTSSLLQAKQAVVQAGQNLSNAQSNLTTDYNSSYTDISNTFIDLPGVMTGLNNVIYSTSLNKVQNNIDAYTNLVATYNPNVQQYNLAAVAAYQQALSAYNQNLTDFKNTNIYASTSTVESLLAETYATLKAVSVANSNLKNFLDIVVNTMQQYNQKTPAQLNTDETSMQSYISTVNGHLATIFQVQNSLATDKQAIISGNLSVSQTSAALEQLQSGATALAIEQQQLAVTQAQNALTDARANLDNDYVRAPFAGIITSITAKLDQPASGTLGVLVSDQQLAQATFNEVDIVNVKLGQKANVTFDALPDLTLTGKVVQIDTLGTVTQGVVSYNVQVALDVANDTIKPGMSDTLSIITNVKQDVILVPNAAVSTRPDGSSSVQIMGADGKPVATPVQIGLANDSETEIVSGINEGDEVVTRTITSGATPTTQNTGLGGIRIPGFGGGAGR